MGASPVITLFGAAGEVTGSCTLIECAAGRVLVDFGLFQGSPAEEWRNADPPPFDAPSLDAVVVTHAHVDHCGRLGMLPRLGFKGPVIATEPTARLLPRVLRGSATLQATRLVEFESGTMPIARVIEPAPDPVAVARLERRRSPPVIYDHRDAETISSRIESVSYGTWREVRPGLRVRLHDASHVIGSASVEVECAGDGGRPKRVLCSGDLGPATASLLRPRAAPPSVDALVMECTNGARRFGAVAEIEHSLDIVLERASRNGGRVLMPTFSLGRAQNLLLRLARLAARGRLHRLPVYLDSPMAVFASELHARFPDLLADSLRDQARGGSDPLHFDELHYLYSRKQSLKVERERHPAIVLAGSGFCDAGPILHHLAGALELPSTEVVLAGHQIEGTLGHGLAGDARRVQIGPSTLSVRARRTKLELLSGHADQGELLDWVRSFATAPPLILLNHGSQRSRSAISPLLSQESACTVESPDVAAPMTV